ncbi:MAG: DUF3857 domain-containing protein [Flavobacteriaceae bacterium]|nr:DUF3857 domain-containing protein [Flavobacteriaceae bacterium]
MKITFKRVFLLIFSLVVGSFTTISQNYKFGKVSKKELLEGSHPLYPEAEAAILYQETKTSLNDNKEKGFFAVTEVFKRIKIYNQKGFDWGTVEVDLYTSSGSGKETFSGLKAYTYSILSDEIEKVKLNSDGVFDEKKSKYRSVRKFTMPALKNGCIVEYKYRIKSPFLNNINRFSFQESIPVNKLKMRFEAPEYFNYNAHRRGWIPFEIEKDRHEKTVTNLYTSSRNLGAGAGVRNAGKSQIKYFQNISEVYLADVPPIIEEAFAGNLQNYSASLKFELAFVKFPTEMVETYSTDWESVSNTIYRAESFGDQLDKSRYFEDELNQVLSGVTDSNEKMMRIFEFVKEKMNWNGYVGVYTDEGVKNAYKISSGNTADINLMLTAMFRYAGLNANPVLISTKSHGIPIFPTVNGFNYVIAAVETSDGFLLFNATNKYGQPNVLDKSLLNWKGRVVTENGESQWVSLNPSKLAVEAFMVNAILDSEGRLKGSVKNQFAGNSALENRSKFVGLSEADVKEELEKSYEELSITEVKFENLHNPYESLKIDYKFTTESFVEVINGNLYVSPLTVFKFG